MLGEKDWLAQEYIREGYTITPEAAQRLAKEHMLDCDADRLRTEHHRDCDARDLKRETARAKERETWGRWLRLLFGGE